MQARTGELPAKTFLLEWDPGDKLPQSDYAKELISGLFSFTQGWLEPLALEVEVGGHDGDVFEEDPSLAEPFHLLMETNTESVRIDPLYSRSIPEVCDSLSREHVNAWIIGLVAQPSGRGGRSVTSLRRLWVQASRARVPCAPTESSIALQYDVGTMNVPLEQRGNERWVIAPPLGDLIPQPVAIDISNENGWLRMIVKIYWSPWLNEEESGTDLISQGLSRLFARRWTMSEG